MAGISVQRVVVLIVVTVLLIGGAVFGGATIGRNSALRTAQQQTASSSMLSAMLNQETGARLFRDARERFLPPYVEGTSSFGQARSESRSLERQ